MRFKNGVDFFYIFTKNKMVKTYLLLDNIRSVHNVGAMLRTADGAGFSSIICGGFSPTPDDPRIAKVALGAEKSVPWEKSENLLQSIAALKEKRVVIIALETGGEDLFSAEIPAQDLALVVGHEVEGISQEILQQCDLICSLPMHGVKESLNVSIAAGIAMYEITRRYQE